MRWWLYHLTRYKLVGLYNNLEANRNKPDTLSSKFWLRNNQVGNFCRKQNSVSKQICKTLENEQFRLFFGWCTVRRLYLHDQRDDKVKYSLLHQSRHQFYINLNKLLHNVRWRLLMSFSWHGLRYSILSLFIKKVHVVIFPTRSSCYGYVSYSLHGLIRWDKIVLSTQNLLIYFVACSNSFYFRIRFAT